MSDRRLRREAMGEFIELLKRPRRESVIWLDSHNYAGRLLAGGAPPWLEVAAFVAWQRKTQGLLLFHKLQIDKLC